MILTVSILLPALSVRPYRCPVEPTTPPRTVCILRLVGIPIILPTAPQSRQASDARWGWPATSAPVVARVALRGPRRHQRLPNLRALRADGPVFALHGQRSRRVGYLILSAAAWPIPTLGHPAPR